MKEGEDFLKGELLSRKEMPESEEEKEALKKLTKEQRVELLRMFNRCKTFKMRNPKLNILTIAGWTQMGTAMLTWMSFELTSWSKGWSGAIGELKSCSLQSGENAQKHWKTGGKAQNLTLWHQSQNLATRETLTLRLKFNHRGDFDFEVKIWPPGRLWNWG